MYFRVFSQIERTEARDRALGINPGVAAGLGGIVLAPLDIEKERAKLHKDPETVDKPIEKIVPPVVPNATHLHKKVSYEIDLMWSFEKCKHRMNIIFKNCIA